MRSAHYNFCLQKWTYFLLFDKQVIVLRALIQEVSFFSSYTSRWFWRQFILHFCWVGEHVNIYLLPRALVESECKQHYTRLELESPIMFPTTTTVTLSAPRLFLLADVLFELEKKYLYTCLLVCVRVHMYEVLHVFIYVRRVFYA